MAVHRRLAVPRVGEIDPRIEFAREIWSEAEQLQVDRNENAASLRPIDSTNTFTEGNVTTVNEFKSHGRLNREFPSDIVFEKHARGTNTETCHQLNAYCPRGFTYVGGSNAEVLGGAKTAALGSNSEVLSKTNQVGKARAMVADWCRALRLHHWVKNLLLFVPLGLNYGSAPLSTWLVTFAGFLLLGLCASGTYIINDVSDLEADRAHVQKQHRPFAARRLSIASGLVVAGILILSSLAGAMFLSSAFAALLLLYLVLTFTYSFSLKRLPLLDVATLAGLHTLRLGMGIVLSHALLPGSLVFAASLTFLSLALAKRHSEMVNAGLQYSATTSGRGYYATDANIAMAVGVGSALVATQATVSYLLENVPTEMLSRTTLLWSVPVLSCIWLIRVWLFANRGQLNEDLAMFALRDTFTAAVAVCVASSVLLAG